MIYKKYEYLNINKVVSSLTFKQTKQNIKRKIAVPLLDNDKK